MVFGRAWPAVLGLGLMALLATAPPASAAPGDLDPNFGSGGRVVTDFGGSYGGASAVAVQPDGKIVVVGETGDVYEDRSIAVARYHPDGSLDSTFSEDGLQTTDVGGGFSSGGRDLAIQAGGKIVVVGVGGGVGTEQAVVVRYDVDGSLDPTFSDDGQATLDFYSGSAVAIQPDGKIVVGGGVVSTTAPHNQYGFARFTSTGDLDPTFSQDGIQKVSITGLWEDVAALELDSAGRIVAGGRTETDWGLLRLNPNGELDSTFSEDGKQRTDFGGTYDQGSDNLTDLAVQQDGGVVAVGWTLASGALLARYNPDGSMDASFAQNGVQTITGDELPSNAIGLQPNGKIVTTGSGGLADGGFAVARSHPSGSLDTTFLGDGLSTIPFPGYHSARDLALQPDGKILLVGGYKDNGFGSNAEFGVARLEGGDPPVVEVPTPPAPAPPATQTPKAPAPKPAPARLTNVRLSPKTIKDGKRATLSFRLSAPARVSVKILKVKGGVRKGKRCVKPSKATGGKRCDLQVVAFKRSLGAGAHKVKLPRLKAGWHRMRLTAAAISPHTLHFKTRALRP